MNRLLRLFCALGALLFLGLTALGVYGHVTCEPEAGDFFNYCGLTVFGIVIPAAFAALFILSAALPSGRAHALVQIVAFAATALLVVLRVASALG